MPERPDYYALLGVMRNATKEQIKRAYLKAAQRLHPDKNVAAGETELFLDVQQAYQTLTDPKLRAAYDAALPPEKKIKHPIDLKVHYSRESLVRSNETQLVYILLELGAADVQREPVSPPLNVCLLLDCSTSMQGPKLDTAKATATQLIRNARTQDILSVVTFSDRAEVLLPAARNINIHRAESRISTLGTRGGTEIFQGLETGVNEVRRYLNPGAINHVILITDGHTYGDEKACVDLANSAADQGICISALGIGTGWNDTFLDSLAGSTGGSCCYISQPQDIERVLLDKFKSLARTFAEEVAIEFTLDTEAEMTYAFRMQPEAGPLALESPMRLGPILADTNLDVLLEFNVKTSGTNLEQSSILKGDVHFTISSNPIPTQPIPLELNRKITNEPNPEPPPPAILQALQRLNLYRMQERARTEAAAGNYDKASQHLQRMATHLLAQGNRGLAKTVLLEAENLQKQKNFSEEGGKKIKYGTRALAMPVEEKKQ
jgi:Ca-activated chloride channel family protein